MKHLAIFLCATAIIPFVAVADPVADHDTALTAAAVAFDAVKTERDAATAQVATLQSTLTATQAALAACKVAPGCYTPPAPAPAPVPPPSPVPPPAPPAPLPVADTTTIPPIIPSNFDVAANLQPAWGNGAIPASSKPDVLGAFRLQCVGSHLSYNDPLVYPGQKGKSHLHQFFGNTLTDENSTYASLRTSGESTCNNKLNRSGYWMPAMLNGKGGVVQPDFVTIYYKRRPATDPFCNLYGQKGCVDIPRGLRFIFGFNMLGASAPTGAFHYNCQGAGSTPGNYANIVVAAKFCPVGAQLGATIGAPDCWDGKNLDSADHRSHVAYNAQDGKGHAVCPATHPFIIPTFTLGAWYRSDADLDRTGVWTAGVTQTWHLSSDIMSGMPPMMPGTTFHTDWFGAWDDSVLAMWHANCINKLLNCSGGDLGNGKQIKPDLGYQKIANPHVVPIPVNPNGPTAQ